MLDLGEPLPAERLQGSGEPGDIGAGEAVPDVRPVAPGLHQSGLPENPEVGAETAWPMRANRP